jgi:hypothetical protein
MLSLFVQGVSTVKGSLKGCDLLNNTSSLLSGLCTVISVSRVVSIVEGSSTWIDNRPPDNRLLFLVLSVKKISVIYIK